MPRVAIAMLLSAHLVCTGVRSAKTVAVSCGRYSVRLSSDCRSFNYGDTINPNAPTDRIDSEKALQLSEASAHTNGWTYTHYDPTDEYNAAVISLMNDRGGMTVNLSADSLSEADQYYDLGIGPVCVTLPKDAPHRGIKTPNGLPVVVCPAQTQDDMSCARCKLCQVRDRKSIVGFLAHGTASKRLSE